jgi:hypothetical protein
MVGEKIVSFVSKANQSTTFPSIQSFHPSRTDTTIHYNTVSTYLGDEPSINRRIPPIDAGLWNGHLSSYHVNEWRNGDKGQNHTKDHNQGNQNGDDDYILLGWWWWRWCRGTILASPSADALIIGASGGGIEKAAPRSGRGWWKELFIVVMILVKPGLCRCQGWFGSAVVG